MESRCSNFSAQICRHGDYQLRLARSSAYVQAKVAPNLTKNLQKCPKCLVLVDQRLHAKCPSDGLYQPYQWVLDPERWYL
ncbi:unnamed protein product [Meloidogyne enterolobii]|uniref:Uncharacterized protein n=5 Tax=Meloidogyne TaxID=189290 RepID=A0A6V7US23_MELEN|nr:unnamed protein product [Meloidogyne enterolobii]CAD2164520.1 unnamed protein product [Meloidogyne enterolobii]CAD2184644.1 unnamed protein product [Meloidogyne enterolobii]